MDRGSRPAARRRDRALHRDDVPAHPVHRRPREGRDQVRRLVARQVHGPRPPGEPHRQHLGVHGAALGRGARRLRPGADQRRPPAAQGRRRVRRPLRGRPLLGRPRLRPGPRRGRGRARQEGPRRLQEARREDRDHHRPAHDDDAAQRLPQDPRRLRHRGEELPRGAGREGLRHQRPQRQAALAARSSCTTRASSPATRASSTSRASCWRPPASPSATRRTRAARRGAAAAPSSRSTRPRRSPTRRSASRSCAPPRPTPSPCAPCAS